jgi:hypothetical protein
MHSNLDSVAEEIQQYLESEHFIVFRGLSRTARDANYVYWDVNKQPDFRRFLECALQLGVRLVHFHSREFRRQHREDALEIVEDSDLAREEKRDLQRRIKELAIYEGFTCTIELTFDFEGRVYVFELQTDWFEEWQDILDELQVSDPEMGEDESGYGGFYSNN